MQPEHTQSDCESLRALYVEALEAIVSGKTELEDAYAVAMGEFERAVGQISRLKEIASATEERLHALDNQTTTIFEKLPALRTAIESCEPLEFICNLVQIDETIEALSAQLPESRRADFIAKHTAIKEQVKETRVKWPVDPATESKSLTDLILNAGIDVHRTDISPEEEHRMEQDLRGAAACDYFFQSEEEYYGQKTP